MATRKKKITVKHKPIKKNVGKMKVQKVRPKKCTGSKIPRACARLRKNNKNYI